MSNLNRRTFSQGIIGSTLTFSLLESLFCRNAFSDEIEPLAAAWLAELNTIGNDIKNRKLTQVEWQEQVENLMAKVDLADLMKFVDFEKLTKNLPLSDRGERAVSKRFPEVQGLPTKLVFGHQIFALKKNRSVAPHGHYNMATAFLVLKGDCHGRHYDRVEDGENFMIIKPTLDQKFGVGDYSTVSDYRDNIHWFKAASQSAYIFNIHVLNVDADKTKRGRVYVDPFGESLSHGYIKAKVLSKKQAYDQFG